MDDYNLKVDEISTSYLHCHCADLKEKNGYFAALNERHNVTTAGGDRFEDISGYLCRDYLEYQALVDLFALIVPMIVLSLNQALLHLTQFLVVWIRYEKKSE